VNCQTQGRLKLMIELYCREQYILVINVIWLDCHKLKKKSLPDYAHVKKMRKKLQLMSYNMMIGYDIYDCFTMEHFRLRQKMTFTTKIYSSRLYVSEICHKSNIIIGAPIVVVVVVVVVVLTYRQVPNLLLLIYSKFVFVMTN
jgi:hypothetical protein